MNDTIFFSLLSPVFVFTLIIGIFSSERKVALETILRLCKEVSDFAVGGKIVWDGISIDGSTDPDNIRNEALTGQRCRHEILKHIAVSYAAVIGADFILMDENCAPHRLHLVDDFIWRKESYEWNE